MSIITMSQTVGELTSGQTYRVRAKTAELLVAQSKATKTNAKKISGPGNSKEGK
jgi:hypothetical protein